MKTAVLSMAVISVLAIVVCLVAPAQGVPGAAPQAAGPGSGSGNSATEVFTLNIDDQRSQVMMVDPATRAMSVYHVDRVTGEIELMSVRNCHWDLQMGYFNNRGLLPNQIRSQAEPR